MRRHACLALLVGFAVGALGAQETDRDKVFYQMANGLGLLRTVKEIDSIMTLQSWGHGWIREVAANGTVGPEIEVKSLYQEFAYDFPGLREEIVRADGARAIEVVSGLLAWNELEKMGGGIEPGWGSATPMMDTVPQRLIRIWMSPMGVVKAARAAGDRAKVSVQSGRMVVTFPLVDAKPEATVNMVVGGLRGTPMKVTLDAMYRPAQVEITFGGHKYSNAYSNYADWNEADLKADVFLPGRIVATFDGQTVLDITIDKTNTYNPFVIMPTPEIVAKATSR